MTTRMGRIGLLVFITGSFAYHEYRGPFVILPILAALYGAVMFVLNDR